MRIQILLMLLLAVSCGKKDKGTDTISRDNLCENNSKTCILRGAEWHITVQRNDFPQNALVSIAGDEVVNECESGGYPFKVDRGTEVTMTGTYADITQSDYDIKIYDLGSNCLEKNPYQLSGSFSRTRAVLQGKTYITVLLQ
jgi:hypothetical protein